MTTITPDELVSQLERLDKANRKIAADLAATTEANNSLTSELSQVIAEARAMVDGEQPVDPPPQPPPDSSSPYVDCRPLKIESARPADIIKPLGINPMSSNQLNAAAGKIIDLRGTKVFHRRASQGQVTPFVCSGGPDAVFTGGTSTSDNEDYQQMDWREAHGHAKWDNAPCLRIDGVVGDAWFQGFDLRWGMDAIIIGAKTKADQTIYLEALHVVDCLDDCIQKDGGAGTTVIYNCKFEGHVFISRRPGAEAGPGSKALFKISKTLVYMGRHWYTTDEKGTDAGVPGSKRKGPYISPSDHSNEAVVQGNARGAASKWPFKTQRIGSSETTLMDLDLEDVCFCLPSMPLEGAKASIFPTDGKYRGVTMVWLGGGKWDDQFPQSKAQLNKLGIEVIDDEEIGYEHWKKADLSWYAANGYRKDETFTWTRQE